MQHKSSRWKRRELFYSAVQVKTDVSSPRLASHPRNPLSQLEFQAKTLDNGPVEML